MMIAVFILPENLHHGAASIHAQLQALGLTPVTRRDAFNILTNPFVERYQPLLDYARREIEKQEDGTKGMGQKELKGLIEEVVERCLEIPCKVYNLSFHAVTHRENFLMSLNFRESYYESSTMGFPVCTISSRKSPKSINSV